ncbi:MAG TPA: M18 family aminopeptidase [Turneriella sp.]|nr:M18 family aminopeptidase [Turneriella sp.]
MRQLAETQKWMVLSKIFVGIPVSIAYILRNFSAATTMTLTEYLASPSPAWAAENASTLLKSFGFEEATHAHDGVSNKLFARPFSGMLLAAHRPQKIDPAQLQLRIIGAHTDSPHLRLKSNSAAVKEGHTLLTSEVYGGALLYTWFDRPLGLAGEIFYKENNTIQRKLIRIQEPIAVVPSLAIHLARGVNDDGFKIEKTQNLHALLSLTEDISLDAYLASVADIPTDALLSYDLSLFDTTPATQGGLNNELLMSARLDNLVSAHSAITALKKADSPNIIAIAALFDHEEIGSVSEAGAESVQLEKFLRRIQNHLKITDTQWEGVLQRSLFLSADMAHGVHPNYADKSDTENRPRLGGGVTLKMNQNRRYATSAAGAAFFHDLCRTHKIPSQVYTHRNDLPCGSTLGPAVSARLGMTTIDVGVAMLAMHSIREICAIEDLESYRRFMEFFMAKPLEFF